MGYRQIMNAHAMKVLSNRIDIPDYRLMVGSAERLEDTPLLIPQAKIPLEVAQQLQKYDTLTNDEITMAIQNNMLEVNDFNGNLAIIEGISGGLS